MSVPRWWTPTVRHEYVDGLRSYCGLCGRRWGNAIHRHPRQTQSPATTESPRCAECGRKGYIVGFADLRICGHLDQRVKHAFKESL